MDCQRHHREPRRQALGPEPAGPGNCLPGRPAGGQTVNENGKFRILVVDDEASVLTTYRMILERQGYDVVACLTWREAIAAIERQGFDAVLCDYSLEQQHTGCEVIRAARQRKQGVPAA